MKKAFLVILGVALFLSAKPEDAFRFVVVGDRSGDPVDRIFEETIEEINLLDPDFVMCVGDVVDHGVGNAEGLRTEYDQLLNVVGTLPCKFYWCAGNNEIAQESDRELYKKKTGFNTYYSFNHKNSHFIVLDNTMTYFAQPQALDAEQLSWLEKDLEKHRQMDNIFAFYHIPTYIYALQSSTTDTLVQIFEKYGVDLVFTGHHHAYSYLNRNNIEYINVGSSGGGMSTHDPARGHFYHYLMVTVKGNERNIAVLKKGSALPRNVVTLEDIQTIRRMDEQAITMDNYLVDENEKHLSQRITVTVNNLGPDSLISPIIWHADPTRYSITPLETPVALASEEKDEYKFNVMVHDGSRLFPLPSFTLAYPFTYGKVCTLYNLLAVKRHKYAEKTASPPAIDGRLDDALWSAVMPIEHFANGNGTGEALIEKTQIYFAHDNDNLYFAARCFESNFSQLHAQAFEHDGATFYDDNIWLFFDTNLDVATYYQAIINCNGAVFDRKCATDGTRDASWNAAWEVASGREEGAWTLEFKIAKAELAPYNEDRWGFNMRRLQTRLNDAGYWSIPFGHAPQYFGILEFK